MEFPRGVFRTYDIRGLSGLEINETFAFSLGRAVAQRADEGSRFALGRDCRADGEALQLALMDGLCAEGAIALDLGMVPTPTVYFGVYEPTYAVDAGIVVTASHNPIGYNGFKITLGKRSFYGEDLQRLYDSMCALEPRDRRRCEHPVLNLVTDYVQRIAAGISLGRRLRVVIDGGNGSGGLVALAICRALGVEGIGLFCEPDGNFPNHHPDPTVAENLVDLQRAVVEHRADFGLALDGDSDRLGVVDERGEIIVGDRLLLLLANELLRANPGATVIGEVKCSTDLFAGVTRAGGRAVMSAVGHSILKDRMVSEGALLAGEMSGHIYFADRYYGFDDALYAAARLMEIVASREEPLSWWFKHMPAKPASPEIRIECADSSKFRVVEVCTARFAEMGFEIIDIDGVRFVGEEGWGLVRASNTQPALVLRAEGSNEAALERLLELVHRVVAEAIEAVES
jgi:phosphomannomutase/phosphoglucomutase